MSILGISVKKGVTYLWFTLILQEMNQIDTCCYCILLVQCV